MGWSAGVRSGYRLVQSGFFGTPAHGFGIVGWGGGAGCPFCLRASDCPCRVTTTPASRCAVARSGFGVVSSEHAHRLRSAGSVVVALECGPDGLPKCLTVTDTGVGIAPEHQSAVFEPFAQEDSTISRRFGGTGLGLAISKHYCEMMGLSLTLESAAGKGSTFRIGFRARG